MNKRRPSLSGRSGFTLLELLAALAMTVVIAGALGTALFVAFQAKASAQRAVESTRRLDMLATALVRDLPNALPPTGQMAAEFVGTAETVSFYTTGPEPGAELQADMRRVEYALADGTGGRTLVRRVTTNLLADVETVPPDEAIAQGVAAFALSYYDGSAWTDNWDSTAHGDALPVAVQVTVDLAPGREDEPARRFLRTIPLSCGVPASVTGTGGAP